MMTPRVVRKVIVLAAETRSFARAVIALNEADISLSASTVQRVVLEVGGELATRRDADPKSAEALAIANEQAPELAVVECDGGRLRCREPGHGPGVHLEGTGWREDKNACLIRAQRKTFHEDPQPDPPACFSDPLHVAKLTETQAFSAAAPVAAEQELSPSGEDEPAVADVPDWRPVRLVRTVLSSMADSTEFGRQMNREAKRRGFYKAEAKAFLGDGLPWNWSIWNTHFRTFIPILDFIHPLSYLFLAAKAVHAHAGDAWSQYQVWMRGCWNGEIDQVLQELQASQQKLGPVPDDADENDPRHVLTKTIGYLQNNRSRMDYPDYRSQGLPVTTAWMESLVKEVNYRVKGTEMFWNNPQGAEAILQVRAAALSEDDRMIRHLENRQGSPFTRPPRLPKPAPEKCKS